MVLSLNGCFVVGFHVAAGHLWMVSSTLGSRPVAFWVIADAAIRRRLRDVNMGAGPREVPLCFPGNQSGSSATFCRNSVTLPWDGDSALYARPVLSVFNNLEAIQLTCTWPPLISLLASRRAKARACCQGDSRPGAAACHSSRNAF